MPRKSPLNPFAIVLAATIVLGLSPLEARAQVTCFGDPTCIQPETGHPVGMPGTPNIEVVGHLPLPGIRFSHADIEVEQEMSRPLDERRQEIAGRCKARPPEWGPINAT